MKEGNDLEKGWLSIASPLGQAILGADEGDEIEFPLDGGRRRRALIERVERVRYPLVWQTLRVIISFLGRRSSLPIDDVAPLLRLQAADAIDPKR
jgi:Transcription elongation factor, GreA/GreB, C-term